MRFSQSPPSWHEVTAVYGGRFDPPHVGHREAVRGLFKSPGIKQVLVVPSAIPPHKPAVASAQHRLEMARLNFQNELLDPFPTEVQIDSREIERGLKNPQIPNYSYNTIQELRPLYSQLAFVIGTDQFLQLHTWHRFPEILNLCHWIVLNRKAAHHQDFTHQTASLEKIIGEWTASGLLKNSNSHLAWNIRGGNTFLMITSTDAPPFSSTTIRESIARAGTPPIGSLFPKVEGYLKDLKLYGM